MKTVIRGFVGVTMFLMVPMLGWAGSTCVDCHKALPHDGHEAHDYSEWQKSVHAKKGVTCEQCHGGDATSPTMQKAHTGLYSPQKKGSPLYFTEIPKTCGKCHAAELAEFKKSFHYKELERSGHGPNCVTCHGAMAVDVLQPQQMENTCSVCHRVRTDAVEGLVTLNLAGAAMRRWESVYTKAVAKKLVTTQETEKIRMQRSAYADVQRQWHAFAMKAVVQNARAIVNTAKQETQSLRLKLGAKTHDE